MSRLRRRHAGTLQALDLAPVVDVALILVVFLLLTADLVDRHSLPVQLPVADHGGAQPGGERLELTILANGMVYHGDDLLGDAAAISRSAQGHSLVVLRVDKDCPHGDYLRVVDTLIGAGVPAIHEATKPRGRIDEW